MTEPKILSHAEVNRILNTCLPGDHLTVTRINGGSLTSVVSGPVLCEPSVSGAVGIDLLDGEPHIVRRENGSTFGLFESIEVRKPDAPKPTHTVRYRDAITGEYITAEEAAERPDTTIRETRRI